MSTTTASTPVAPTTIGAQVELVVQLDRRRVPGEEARRADGDEARARPASETPARAAGDARRRRRAPTRGEPAAAQLSSGLLEVEALEQRDRAEDDQQAERELPGPVPARAQVEGDDDAARR